MKFNKKTGFTLAEAIITLSLISVILAVMIPVATKTSPSANKVAFKSAYGMITSVIESLINNETLYPSQLPDAEGIGASLDTNGFTFTAKTAKVVYTPASGSVPEDSEDLLAPEFEARTQNCLCSLNLDNPSKLVSLFACSMNIISTSTVENNTCSYRTSNGMDWTATVGACSPTALNTPCMTIQVDVNGDGMPNSTACTRDTDGKVLEPVPDRYFFNVFYDGTVRLANAATSSPCAVAILKEPTKNRKNR